MKKLVITGIMTAAIAASVVTAQTSYACFCIKGIIWEPACDQLFPPKPTPPADKPIIVTPSTPAVTVSTVVKTPAPQPAAPAELPRTGASEIALAAFAVAGVVTYGGVYLIRRPKN